MNALAQLKQTAALQGFNTEKMLQVIAASIDLAHDQQGAVCGIEQGESLETGRHYVEILFEVDMDKIIAIAKKTGRPEMAMAAIMENPAGRVRFDFEVTAGQINLSSFYTGLGVAMAKLNVEIAKARAKLKGAA